MPIDPNSRSIAILIATFSMSLMAASCSKTSQTGESSAAYQAACEGAPLRTIEQRNKAMEDGDEINQLYNCIDKASFAAAKEARAKWEAANTPEALAQRAAERAKKIAEEDAQKAATLESERLAPPPPPFVLRHVDVNRASESELANVPSVGRDVAAQIVQERKNGRFKDWADLVNRVIGIHSAQNAVFSSVSGLNVDGQSLTGAPPDAAMAAALSKKYQKN
jgi:DNA uptake protein ComE-like DNA-binding protein